MVATEVEQRCGEKAFFSSNTSTGVFRNEEMHPDNWLCLHDSVLWYLPVTVDVNVARKREFFVESGYRE